MNVRSRDALSNLFKFVCGFAAFFMVGFWLIKFHKNEDVSSIGYISYEDPMGMIYPELSVCIQMPFTYQTVLSDFNGTVSADEYTSYMKGEARIRDEYKRITYHNVTVDILEHVQLIVIYLKNEPRSKNLSCTSIKNCRYVKFENNFNGFNKDFPMKCFGFKLQPNISHNVESFTVVFQPNLQDEIYKVRKNTYGQIYLGLNYPGQILRAPGTWKPIWKTPDNSLSLLAITVSAMEVLRRRNKHNDPCFTGGAFFDDMVLKEHQDTLGCSTPYHKSEKPLCTTRKQMNDSRYEMRDMRGRYHKTIKRPCEELANIVYTADEIQFSEKVYNGSLKFHYSYPEKIKVIQQVKSVDLHALIGNIGGYIGLFLGNICSHSSYLYYIY